MSRLAFDISVSLDGYIAGPEQSLENPLGIGGEQLHEWVTSLESWRRSHGLEGGKQDDNSEIVDEMTANIGATIMGRGMFGGGPGPWAEGDDAWNGWWGDQPPFRTPVFVLTHHPRESLEMDGGTTFHFVTDGIESALEGAREAAGDQDIRLGGGADAARQYLGAGLVDEVQMHVVPVLLGSGERLFDGLDPEAVRLEQTRSIGSANVTHLRFDVVS